MNNTVIVRCDEQGFERNWIEYRSAWTQREIRGLAGLINQAFIDTIKPKIVALNIELPDGTIINKPDDLDIERLLDADVLVWGWLTDSPLVVIAMRSTLGKVSGRPSFSHNGVTSQTMQPPVPNLNPQN